MKLLRAIITAALSTTTMLSFAQTPLQSLSKMFSTSAVSIECDYRTSVQGTVITGQSQLVAQGQMYSMIGNGLEVYCDGKCIWTIDEASREVVIESCSEAGQDYLANPLMLLLEVEKYFTLISQNSLQAGLTEYVMEATMQCGVKQADLIIASDGELKKARFTLEDGTSVEVNVASMKKTEEKPASFFSPSRKFGSDWIVTDLR